MPPTPAPRVNLQSQFGLDDRVMVVTGASSGIGRAMAGFLATAGASVVLVARREAELQQAAAQIAGDGGGASASASVVAADLTDLASLPDTARRCEQAFGRVDGVVNAAGAVLRQPADAITVEGWNRTLNLNLAAPFFFSREFVGGMKQRHYGRIINIASLQSARAFVNGLAYGASKGGVCQLTRAMAEAWSKHGITCNAIAPGFFPTRLTAAIFDDPQRAAAEAAQTAIGRNGELADLFGATVFFASAACGYVTGQTLFVDGGYTAK